MQIVSICGIGICGALLCLILRRDHPEFSAIAAVACAVAMILAVLDSLGTAFAFADEMLSTSGIPDMYIAAVMKSLGIAYITQFSVDMCRDSGQSGIASKIELAGKIAILITAIPILRELLDIVRGITEKGL